MSDSLDPRTRAFLRSVQDGDDPTRADRDRVRRKLTVRLAAGAAALASSKAGAAAAATGVTTPTAATVAGATASTAPAAMAAAGTGMAVTKIASALLVVAALAGGTTAVVRHARRAHVPAFAPAPALAPAPVAAPVASGAAVGPAGVATGRAKALQVPPPPAAIAAPAATIADGAGTIAVEPKRDTEAARTPAAPARLAASSAAPLPASAATSDTSAVPATSAMPATSITSAPAGAAPPTLDDEIALVRDARAALRAGDAARSLSLLDTHDRLFPDGALGEDCAAERVYALCALGRTDDARVVATRFLAEHPVSPHAAAVRASCGIAGATN